LLRGRGSSRDVNVARGADGQRLTASGTGLVRGRIVASDEHLVAGWIEFQDGHDAAFGPWASVVKFLEDERIACRVRDDCRGSTMGAGALRRMTDALERSNVHAIRKRSVGVEFGNDAVGAASGVGSRSFPPATEIASAIRGNMQKGS